MKPKAFSISRCAKEPKAKEGKKSTMKDRQFMEPL